MSRTENNQDIQFRGFSTDDRTVSSNWQWNLGQVHLCNSDNLFLERDFSVWAHSSGAFSYVQVISLRCLTESKDLLVADGGSISFTFVSMAGLVRSGAPGPWGEMVSGADITSEVREHGKEMVVCVQEARRCMMRRRSNLVSLRQWRH
jgi:hypothetical protein